MTLSIPRVSELVIIQDVTYFSYASPQNMV